MTSTPPVRGALTESRQVASRLPVHNYSDMQKTVEYTNNRVSPATVELLIRERNKGKTLRQLGQLRLSWDTQWGGSPS